MLHKAILDPLRPLLTRAASPPASSVTRAAKRVTVVNLPRGGARWASWRAPLRTARPFNASLEFITVASVCAMCFALLRASRKSSNNTTAGCATQKVACVFGRCRRICFKM